MILIDDRAGSRDLIKYPPLSDPNLATLCKIGKGSDSSADIAFSGNGPSGPIMVGIEIKKVSDLITSLESHRLQGTQIPTMIKDGYHVRWILTYGLYRPSPNSAAIQVYRYDRIKKKYGYFDYVINGKPVNYGKIECFLSGPSLLHQAGFHVKRTNSIEESAVWIAWLYHTWQRPYHTHKSLRVLDENYNDVSSRYRKLREELNLSNGNESDLESMPASILPGDEGFEQRMRTAKSLPSIGIEKAIALAGHFKSTLDMLNASQEELASVQVKSSSGRIARLGPVIAKSIWEKLRK